MRKDPANIDSVLIMSNFSNEMGFAWNNIYQLFEAISSHLSARNVKVYVSFTSVRKPIDEKFNGFDDCFCLPSGSIRPADVLKLLKVIRSKKVKAMYLTDQKNISFLYLLYRIFGVKRIIVHNRVSVASPEVCLNEIGIRPSIKWMLSRVPGINCDKVYAVSNFVKSRLVNRGKIPQRRVRVIINGVDTEKFKPPVREIAEKSSVLRIYCGGRASKYKGFQYLFEAAGILVNERKVSNFVIDYAGDGPDLKLLKDCVKSFGIEDFVHFHGKLDSTAVLQRRSDIIVVPSAWGDACPSAVAEALACGKPLITTAAGGIPEMIEGSRGGLLVPHSDAFAIADALERVVCDESLRDQLSREGRAWAVEALDIKRYHKEVVAALHRDLNL